MNIRWCLWGLVGIMLVSGCASSKLFRSEQEQRIASVKLFHPRVREAKTALSELDKQKVFIEGPLEKMMPDKKYNFLVYDGTVPLGNSKLEDKPKIVIYPSVGDIVLTPVGSGWFSFELDGEKLKKLKSIEVIILARGGLNKSVAVAAGSGEYLRTKFDVEPEKPASSDGQKGASDFIKIQEGPVDPAEDKPFFLITYYGEIATGKDLCNDVLRVRSDPADILDNVQCERNTAKVLLKKNRIKEVDSFAVEAENVLQPSLSIKAKTAAGYLVTQKISIKRGKPVTAALNCWAQDNTEKEFGENFARYFFACDLFFANTNDKPMLVYGSSLTAEVRYLTAEKDVESHFGPSALSNPQLLELLRDGNGRPVGYLDWKENRRPMSFSDIISIFDYQRQNSTEYRLMEHLKFVGALATAAQVFFKGVDYPKGIGIFTGVFTPELEKLLLWDVALHLKNIQARSLRELEEVPANGQIHRVVFFPRGPIYNIIPEMPVYIAEIRPKGTRVEATLIEKIGTVETPANK